MRPRGSALVGLAEVAYDLELQDEHWLCTLLKAGLPALDHGLGLAGQEYRLPSDEREVQLRALRVAAGPKDFAERHLRALATTAPEVLRRQLRSVPVTTGSACGAAHPGELDHYLSHIGDAKDVVYFTAVDAGGAGIAVFAPLSRVAGLSRRDRKRWEMVAAHVEVGHRLRRAVAEPHHAAVAPSRLPHGAEAVLETTSFQVVDAVGRAKERHARKRIRDTAIAIDQARGQMRETDPDRALEMWRALVQGRWSWVDWFDSDRRRFVLAIPNPPHVADPRGLTERESQVLSYAASGHTNKMIAYRLGLSKSAVSRLLGEAKRKLRVRTRAELVRKVRDFQMMRRRQAESSGWSSPPKGDV